MSLTGEIRPMRDAQPAETVTRAAIPKMRPARNEIIICTVQGDSKSGCQLWGSIASGLFYPHGRKM